MKVLNYSTKIKRTGFVKPKTFDVILYPGKTRGYTIVFRVEDKDWYLDHSLTLNSSWECAGIWPSEQSAHLFIVEKFYD